MVPRGLKLLETGCWTAWRHPDPSSVPSSPLRQQPGEEGRSSLAGPESIDSLLLIHCCRASKLQRYTNVVWLGVREAAPFLQPLRPRHTKACQPGEEQARRREHLSALELIRPAAIHIPHPTQTGRVRN